MFKTDEKLEQEGIILDYGDFRVKIAHAGGSNKKFKNLLSARLKPYERQLAIGTMDDEVAAQVIREVYADSIILNFETKKVIEVQEGEQGEPKEEWVTGVPAEDGAVLPYNRDSVCTIFKNIPRLFQDVKAQAENFSLFRAIEVAENSGN
jgi:hypothetical protein